MAIGAVGNPPPPAGREQRLSPCEKICLEIVAELGAQKRHTAREIDAAIRASGRKPWGWATLTAALANLVALGILLNEKDKRGYGLPPELKPLPERKTHAKRKANAPAPAVGDEPG